MRQLPSHRSIVVFAKKGKRLQSSRRGETDWSVIREKFVGEML